MTIPNDSNKDELDEQLTISLHPFDSVGNNNESLGSFFVTLHAKVKGSRARLDHLLRQEGFTDEQLAALSDEQKLSNLALAYAYREHRRRLASADGI